MKKIAIFGAGGFGREVKMLIEQINNFKQQWEFIGFFDDSLKKGEIINNSLVLGNLSDLNNWDDSELFIAVAVGSPATKKLILQKLNNQKIKFATLIHPSVFIGNDNVIIEEGCIIAAGVIITVDVIIHAHVILNLSCTVGHDTKIGEFSSFMPSVNISGEVEIKEGVYVGTGAKIINQLVIGEWTTIGAGAVVAKSLPPKCTAVGIPAKPIKFHE